MAFSIRKTIPSSDWYSGSGDTTITLYGTNSLEINSKKDMVNIEKPKSKQRRTNNPSDKFDVEVVDLKRGTDSVKIRGWLEDDSNESAWNKAWKLRAMEVVGGPCTEVFLDNIEYSSNTQQAFVEEVIITANPTDTNGTLDTNMGDDRARIEIEISLLIGDER